jgi:hypothetical protein
VQPARPVLNAWHWRSRRRSRRFSQA